jgi:hypothetical protein
MAGLATAQAASSRLRTAAAQVQLQITLCGICCAQRDTGAGFLRVLKFPWQFALCQLVHIH